LSHCCRQMVTKLSFKRMQLAIGAEGVTFHRV
jgi:hypothetical protein